MSDEAPTNSEPQLTIRHASEPDTHAVTDLINTAFQVEKFFLGSDRLNADEVRLRLERGTFLLLEDAAVLVGCVYAELRGESGYVGLLSVAPQRQKAGLSRMLMAAAEEYFRANGCRCSELRIVNLRKELPPYYRHLGYQEVGTEKFPAEIPAILPCHFLVMRKVLL
jgi:predicted N-acetyltransferase YhbS